MATFRKRDSGWWQAIVRRGEAQESKTFATRREAEIWATKIEDEANRGAYVSRQEAESTTLKAALERYLREVTPRKRGSMQEKSRIQGLLGRRWLVSRSMAAIRGSEAAQLRDERQIEGCAPSTIMKDLALLSHLFEIARKEWGIEVDNPVKKITKPKIANARSRRLSDDERRYLFAALDDPGDAVKVKDGNRRNVWTPIVARFAIETAMRQGEILARDGQHIDLDSAVVHLPETKNGTTRDVPLSSTAVLLLRGDEKVTRFRKGKVFNTTASAIKQSFSRAVDRGRRNYLADCDKQGATPVQGFLEDLTFHDLRHVATELLAERLQLHQLMRVTGHKDPRMLARYYHPRAEDLAKLLG